MALRLEAKVVPGSGKSVCIVDKQHKLKCYVKAQAQDGKANQELIKLFAQICHVTQKDVDIVMGLTSRTKVLLIRTELNVEQFLNMIGFEKQKSIF